MAVEVLTTEDLAKFKAELLHEFRNLLKENSEYREVPCKTSAITAPYPMQRYSEIVGV